MNNDLEQAYSKIWDGRHQHRATQWYEYLEVENLEILIVIKWIKKLKGEKELNWYIRYTGSKGIRGNSHIADENVFAHHVIPLDFLYVYQQQ